MYTVVKMSEENSPSLKETGLAAYRSNKVRRIGPKHFLVKTESGIGSYLVEVNSGTWVCECSPTSANCPHRYAARLCAASAVPLNSEDDRAEMRCRYCGSPDISGCGYRYNAYGISRRYRCNECLRKFSVKYLDRGLGNQPPSEFMWLISEISMVLSKLEDLLEKIQLNLPFDKSNSARVE
jgi:DNA-directed RNA polymerase subunit RPC12/RpoP